MSTEKLLFCILPIIITNDEGKTLQMKTKLRRQKHLKKFLCSLAVFSLITAGIPAVSVHASETAEPPAAYFEAAQTDALAGWPKAPAIYAESGILVDLDTREILYSKNIDKQLYPASITKIMTTLVAIESSSPEETVTFSQHALDSIEWDSSNIGCRLNETLTMEQCWYAMLLNSANEVCCGVAEHISGSIEAFVEKMNRKAAELGCTATHFSNTNGLPDDTHYTTAHDMALIAAAAYQNETFRTVFTTRQYEIPPTPQYTETRYLYNHHKMMQPDTEYYYEGCLGGKTGYTEKALNTLVTIASRNGRNLLCVTMRTQGRQVYTDTASLFDYGFSQTFPEGEAELLTQPTPTITETPVPEASLSATEVPGTSDEPEAPAEEKTLPPAVLLLSALFLLGIFGFCFQLSLTSRRKKHRRRRRKRR